MAITWTTSWATTCTIPTANTATTTVGSRSEPRRTNLPEKRALDASLTRFAAQHNRGHGCAIAAAAFGAELIRHDAGICEDVPASYPVRAREGLGWR
jgi:hypothetical protein